MRRSFLLALALSCVPLAAEERLVLIGGGDLPKPAVERFVAWAGGPQARILIVTWASGEAEESLKWLSEELGAFGPAAILAAPFRPLTSETREQFLKQLAQATGVFFSGGDQTRVMDVLQDRELLEAVRRKHAAGAVFGGTSAGTAIMSRIMITGEGDVTLIDGAKVETREGLGLLRGVIADQHFVKRRRENRLFGLVLLHPEQLGVGVDEAAALLVRDSRHAEAVGGQVMIVDARGKRGGFDVTLLQAGERFDLVKRKRQ